jgi:ADP-dependent NAD(P)H-hydrate dehydratase / NAD(P)H-hydrate epimerase
MTQDASTSLPQWCEPLLDAEAMRAVDRWAIERQQVPSLELMERAGLGVARAVERHTPDGPVAVVCGKGNNGGDGFVAARVLRAAGRSVTVWCTAPLAEIAGDARANLELLPGEPPLQCTELLPADALDAAAVIVDALLGTGFDGEPRDAVRSAIEAINAAAAPVVSVDVPSGVAASSGEVSGAAVRAAVTVTFHAAKPGLWVNPGKQHAGEVQRIEIGVPRGAPVQPAVGLILARCLAELPKRAASSTKFVSGHVVLAGGSRGLTGAPTMASLAAARAGAGYVTACVPQSLEAIVAAKLLEVMTRALPDDGDGALTAAAVGPVLQAAGRGGALALGPGLGRSDGAFAFARELARRAPLPLVLDADGLNAHAGQLESLAARAAATVLTPHAGELARLLATDSEQIERRRLQHVREAARRARAVVVLKGDDTLVADPSGRVAVSAGGSPALATAGTGDVLTGVLAALLAQGLEPFTAACVGVHVHAQAGRLAARAQGAPEGVIASDVIAALPAARGGRSEP